MKPTINKNTFVERSKRPRLKSIQSILFALILLFSLQACDKSNCEDDPCAEGCGECPDICLDDPCGNPDDCPGL